MTDVLGICESWTEGPDGRASVRREDGTLVEMATRDVVSGKPVPPRPSPRLRLTPEEVHLRAMEGLRSRVVEHLGGWVLRASGGSTGRTNSVLPAGDPGVPLDEAIERVLAFYAEHDRAPWAQVVVGSEIHHELERRGWVRARPDEADVEVRLAGVSRVRRALAARPASGAPVRLAGQLTREWLVGNERALTGYDAVRVMLQGTPDAPIDVVFASVEDADGTQVARGRASYSRDWVVLTDLLVQPPYRHRGHALTVLDALLDWGAERGATTVQLQVIGDNGPAVALYESLGFALHHSYRYLAAPT